MPRKNSVKVYVENGYYHVYNRGVEKRIIFGDEQDYKVFLKYLKDYLSPPLNPNKLKIDVTLQGSTFKGIPRQTKNYAKQIELLAFCLMPNHFHLLLKQQEKKSIKRFMQSLSTRYSMYFNKKHDRVGGLFQGIYKAVLVDQDSYLLHLSRYIHLNPSEYTKNLDQAYSSYSCYLGKQKAEWVKPKMVLSFFQKTSKKPLRGANTYKRFVEDYQQESQQLLGKLTLE